MTASWLLSIVANAHRIHVAVRGGWHDFPLGLAHPVTVPSMADSAGCRVSGVGGFGPVSAGCFGGGGSGEVQSTVSTPSDARASRILHGPIGTGVLRVALPSVATMLLQTFNGFLDRFFIGGLGTPALAAVSLCMTLIFTLSSAAMAVSVGASAMVARFTGSGERDDAVETVRQALLLGVAVAVVLAAVVLVTVRPLLALQGLRGASLDEGTRYLFWSVLALPFSFLVWVQGGIFRGLGDTVRPFWVTLGSNLVHAALNSVLIEGNLGFPKLGIVGGAVALGISWVAASALQWVFLRRGPLAAGLDLRKGADREWMRRIARVGLPAGGQQLLRTGSMLLFQNMLQHRAGDVAVAALGVGLVAESLAFMPGFGYSIAASAFVGQNLGAGNIPRASRSAWVATAQAMAVMTVFGLLFTVYAEPFARLFVRSAAEGSAVEGETARRQIELVVVYLRIALVSEPFLALGMVLSGALQGAGETLRPTLLVAFCSLAVRLPLGWVLLESFGVPGAWWSMSISTILQGLLTVPLFHSGRWKTAKV